MMTIAVNILLWLMVVALGVIAALARARAAQ